MTRRRGLGTSALVLLLATAILIPPAPSSRTAYDQSVPRPTVGSGSWSPAAPPSSASNALFVSPTDPTVVPNDGLETNISGFQAAPLPSGSSLQVAVEEAIGPYDAVFGLFENATFGPTGFFAVFTISGDVSVHLGYSAGLSVQPGRGYEFRLARSNGTVWALTMDGHPFGANASASAFDFQASAATSASGLNFSVVTFGPAQTIVPATLTSTVAFAFHGPSGWRLPNGAQTAFRGSATSRWGVEGRIQSPLLAPGEIRTGTGVSPVPNGTLVWSGGPVAVQIGAILPPQAVGMTSIPAAVSVRDLSGVSIPGLPVTISDSLGGGGMLSVTNATGSTRLVLLASNVSKPANDLVTVASAILGYTGSTRASVALTPAIRVTVSASPAEPTVVLGGTIPITFRTADSSGTPVAFVPLVFSNSAGGRVSLAFGESGADGRLSIDFIAGDLPTSVTVSAWVLEPGAWGHLNLTVHVARPAPTLLMTLEPEIALGFAAALLLAFALGWRRSRRRRNPIPSLPFLPEDPDASGAGGPERSEGRPDPISRTPPSGGIP